MLLLGRGARSLQPSGRRRQALRGVLGQPALMCFEGRVHDQDVVPRMRLVPVLRPALALPALPYLRHHLATLRRVARGDRRPEAHLHLDAAREQPAGAPLRPVLAGRHRLAGPSDPDRHDAEPVLGGEHSGAGVDLADLPVAGARALREHQQVPALLDELVDMIARTVAEATAVAAERDGVEDERNAPGAPARLVEVVGGSGDRGPVAPFAWHRAQDRRRVQVAAVVGHEDHRSRHLLAEHLASVDAPLDIDEHQRSEDAGEDPSPYRPRDRTPRPRHVHLRVLARDLVADAGASRAQLVPELGEPIANLVAYFRHARLELARARFACLHPGVQPTTLTHVPYYSPESGWFRRDVLVRRANQVRALRVV